jgi:hypothetical protein
MKRLIICFDGTWNSADSQRADTNVALLARAIHSTVGTEGIPQSVLYLRASELQAYMRKSFSREPQGLGSMRISAPATCLSLRIIYRRTKSFCSDFHVVPSLHVACLDSSMLVAL